MIELQARLKPAEVNSTVGMIALWERLLDVAPIRDADDFFELGGDSLQALQLFHEIERVTGRTLPITAIYDAPTPSRLVALLDDDAPAPFSPLVLMKSGVGEPLFIAHGIGGHVIELKMLGQSLGTARPVYAIQAKGVDGTEEPLDTVAAMVAYYLDHVRAVQPRGPYYLAGYSFGGVIALEMARQLEADGETVGLLAFIDSYAHPDTFPKAARLIVRLRSALHAFRTKPFREACVDTLARLKRRGADGLATAPIQADLAQDSGNAVARKVHDHAYAALTKYWPTPYAGPVAFFKPAISIFQIAPKRIWGKLVGRITVHRVPGTHSDMVRDHVVDLARALSLTLHRAGEMAKYG